MQVEESFPADGQALEVVHEREDLLDDIAELRQAPDVGGALAGDHWQDPEPAQFTAVGVAVVALVAEHGVRPAPRAAGLASTGGMPSTRARVWVTSLTLAAVVMTLNGVPLPSQIRWCLLPVFPRSIGDGPVASPHSWPRNGVPGLRGVEVKSPLLWTSAITDYGVGEYRSATFDRPGGGKVLEKAVSRPWQPRNGQRGPRWGYTVTAARRLTSVAEGRARTAGPTASTTRPAIPPRRTGSRLPEVAQAFLGLGRRNQLLTERLTGTADGRDPAGETPRSPHEEIREFFYGRQNYLHDIDLPAERLAEKVGIRPDEVVQALTNRLAKTHGIHLSADTGDHLHGYDETTRTGMSTLLRVGQRAFRMATQLALLEYSEALDRQAAEDFQHGSPAHRLARIGIANYFAAALILPYRTFHAAAEEVRYDIERLTDRYGLGYETVCHRLSTLQGPRLRGVPLSFVCVDRAGNMSKRQSATAFHFSRAGGTCPLRNIYEAFAAPGRIHLQIAEMPDGQRYLWTARAVTRHRGGWG